MPLFFKLMCVVGFRNDCRIVKCVRELVLLHGVCGHKIVLLQSLAHSDIIFIDIIHDSIFFLNKIDY